jgi:diacylglycerol kinase family enzyme
MNTSIRSPKKSGGARAAVTAPIQIVVTPRSGNGSALPTALRLRQALTANGWSTSLKSFSRLKNLHRWSMTNQDPCSTIVCVGGDATQSATARVAMRRSVPFVAMPCGFGNLFARAFGQPHAVEDVLDLLTRGQVVRSDVGTRNGELFLCQESYGLIAEIQDAVERTSVPRARSRRWLAYYRAALDRIDDEPPAPLRIVLDGRAVADDAAVVVVANVESYGPWLPLTPGASPVDGLFDVFVLRGATHRQVFLDLLLRHLRLPGTDAIGMLYRARRVSVSGSRRPHDRLEILRRRLPVVVLPETAARLRQGLGLRQAGAAPGSRPATGRGRWRLRVSTGTTRAAAARPARKVNRRASSRPTHTV